MSSASCAKRVCTGPWGMYWRSSHCFSIGCSLTNRRTVCHPRLSASSRRRGRLVSVCRKYWTVLKVSNIFLVLALCLRIQLQNTPIFLVSSLTLGWCKLRKRKQVCEQHIVCVILCNFNVRCHSVKEVDVILF